MGVSEDVQSAIKALKNAIYKKAPTYMWFPGTGWICQPTEEMIEAARRQSNQIELLPSTILKAYRMAKGEHEQI